MREHLKLKNCRIGEQIVSSISVEKEWKKNKRAQPLPQKYPFSAITLFMQLLLPEIDYSILLFYAKTLQGRSDTTDDFATNPFPPCPVLRCPS